MSLAAPSCARCRYFVAATVTEECAHPSAVYRPQTAYLLTDLRAKEQRHSCAHMRERGACGPGGTLYMHR